MFNNVYEAIEAEKRIKGWSRRKKEALINNDFDLIKELAKCKNDTSHLNYERDKPFDSAQGDNVLGTSQKSTEIKGFKF